MKHAHALIAIALVSLLTACASSNSGSVYTREQTRQPQTVKMGVVESVRAVKIEGTKSPVGTAAGAVVGGVAGSSMGEGKGRLITSVLGAIAGGLAGSAIEEGIMQKDGVEITIKLDTGGMLAIVQEATEEFHPGDRIRLLEGGGVSRITH